MKVVKFGGSSVADAGQFQKVKAIIDQDANRQIIVISAAGKYRYATRKLTDTLYLIADGMEAGRDVEPLFNQVLARLEAINIALQLNVPPSNCCIQFAIIWPFAILETIWSLAVSS